MARPRNPNREKAKEIYIEARGEISTKELAIEAEVTEARIRKWKSEDKWDEELSKKKRGGQRGNKNATGHGAAPRNKNAIKHGAYKTVYFDELTEEERKLIESVTLDTQANMLRELQTLIAKENDLKKRIAEYRRAEQTELYMDKVVEMQVPVGKDDEDDGAAVEEGGLKVAMKTIIKATPFDRAMKLEAELNKVNGRIIKLIDSIKAYELEMRRMELEERKYSLMKQRVTGEYDIDPETGEIDDEYEENE